VPFWGEGNVALAKITNIQIMDLLENGRVHTAIEAYKLQVQSMNPRQQQMC
jgi:hypothetical protein